MDLNTETDKEKMYEIDPMEIAKTLFSYKWVILGFGLLALLLGIVYTETRVPVYTPTALIQVGNQNSGASLSNMMGGMGMASNQASPADVEMTLIRSNYILVPVVKKLGLDLSVTPKRFPLFGNFIARQYQGSEPAPARLGMSSYAWGGETITVSDFNPPLSQYCHAYSIVAGQKGHYQLFDPDGALVLTGVVGQLAQSQDGSTNILITQLIARPHTIFYVQRFYQEGLANSLSLAIKVKELSASADAADTGSDTGIVSLSLTSSNPSEAALILNTVVDAISQDDATQKATQSDNMIRFIQAQLPLAKQRLLATTSALNHYQAKTGVISLGAQSGVLLRQISGIDNQILVGQLNRAQLLQTSTPLNPMVQNIDTQIVALKNQRSVLQKQLAALPLKDQEAIGLMRDAQAQGKLYMILLNTAQSALLAKASAVNDIRILDRATPAVEPSPSHTFTILLAFLLAGLGLGSVLVVGYSHLLSGIKDPYWTEKELGIRTLAILPFSKTQAKNKKAFDQAQIKSLPILAKDSPHDLSVESLRSLRTSLFFAMKEHKSNVISIGGVIPVTGKSFISVNLAVILAESGKRVLLMDADMRRGYLNEYFQLSHSPGLSEALTEVYPLEKTVRRTDLKDLDFMSTGLFPQNPSELLLHDRFKDLIDILSKQYDVVIVDAPPILAVNDASLIAQVCGINLLVIPGGQLKAREIESAVRRFYADGVKLHGTVFNFAKKIHHEISAYGYHSRYAKYYKRDQQE